jgi:UDP-N-acetylglucosamine transferase subunit ALG13
MVFVTVGTDFHPFDRLITWIDSWLMESHEERVHCFVQYGTSQPPRRPGSSPYVTHDEMARRIGEAKAVVCHGGPGTIIDCLRSGTKPIVVPRRQALGEHVDDHQLRFARRLASMGYIRLAETSDDFRRLISAAIDGSKEFVLRDVEGERITDAVARFSETVQEQLAVSRDRPTGSRVLYVGGWGRSGSTLLDRLMGQVDGFVSVGEMRDFWLRGCVENRRCGCERPFRSCPFWTSVGDRAFGSWDRVQVDRLIAARTTYDRPWLVPLLALRMGGGRRLTALVRHTARLYEAIHAVSGANTIVDSSKIPSYALLLRRSPSIDVRVVHLVRDSRGVVYSWRKHVLRSDATTRPDHMLRYGVASASARYMLYNGLTELLPRLGVPYLRVRYEDLVEDPEAQVRRILRFAGAKDTGLDFLSGGVATLQAAHTVDGNPIRLARGRFEIQADTQWRESMRVRDRRIVSALTAPLLRHYGYV